MCSAETFQPWPPSYQRRRIHSLPCTHIGRKAVAKRIGALNRNEPPQSEMKNALKIMTDGMEMIRVVVWKNALTAEPIPVSHMWWAQTMKERKPRTSAAKTRDL